MLFSTLDYLKTHFGCDPNKNLCSKVVCELLENEALAKPLDRMDVHLVCGDLRLQVVSEGRVLVTEEQLKRLERQPAVKFYVVGSAPILPRMQRVTGTLHLPGELGRLSERVSERPPVVRSREEWLIPPGEGYQGNVYLGQNATATTFGWMALANCASRVGRPKSPICRICTASSATS